MLNEQASSNLAAELLGYTDPKVTIEHYVRRNEQVSPLTAELLDVAFAPDDPRHGDVMGGLVSGVPSISATFDATYKQEISSSYAY